MDDGLLTLPQTARALGIALDDAFRLIEEGKLAASRGADGGLYVRREDLNAYQQTLVV